MPRLLSAVCEMGLLVQHGSQCGSRDAAERVLDIFLHQTIQSEKEFVGGGTWIDCDMVGYGNESGALGFSAGVAEYRCT